MKRIKATLLAFALLVTGLIAPDAFAQDYKEAYNAALEAARAKNYNEAYTQFTRAAEGAEAEGDTDVLTRSQRVLAQLDYSRGNAAYKAGDFATAIQHFDIGISHNADYAKNYYGKALALKQQENFGDAMATFKQAMDIAAAGGDRRAARAAEDAIRDYYHHAAGVLLAKENPTRSDADAAIAQLTGLQEYLDADADTYYYIAEAHKVKGEYTEAVAAADQALEMLGSRGSATQRSNINFTKGEALMMMGETDAAKAAFANVTAGSFRNSAQHFIETL